MYACMFAFSTAFNIISGKEHELNRSSDENNKLQECDLLSSTQIHTSLTSFWLQFLPFRLNHSKETRELNLFPTDNNLL